MGLCQERDQFIMEKVIWVVDLSDGRTIFQDDEREGEIVSSAWIRLKEDLKETENIISRMRLRYWDNIVFLPDNADGYYFSKAATFDNVTGSQGEFYMAGILVDDDLTVHKYSLPDLIRVETKVVDPEKSEMFLITNNYKLIRNSQNAE